VSADEFSMRDSHAGSAHKMNINSRYLVASRMAG
jgi:hypothetical protein